MTSNDPDQAAAQSISKFRAPLSDLGLYNLDQGGKDTLNAFLCGNELIHSTYFKVPQFRKLLAMAIARSPGFRPSRAFRDDPEFATIEQWYDGLIRSAPIARKVRQNQSTGSCPQVQERP